MSLIFRFTTMKTQITSQREAEREFKNVQFKTIPFTVYHDFAILRNIKQHWKRFEVVLQLPVTFTAQHVFVFCFY